MNRPAVLLLAALALPSLVAGLPLWEGDSAPNWQLQRADGETVDFYQDSRGRVAVLLFWATWCPHCRSLMPHLAAIAEDYQDRPVKIYALNLWEQGDPVAYLRERSMDFELLLNAEAVAEAYGIRGTPGLLVVGPDHQVLYTRQRGVAPEEVAGAVRDALDKALQGMGTEP